MYHSIVYTTEVMSYEWIQNKFSTLKKGEKKKRRECLHENNGQVNNIIYTSIQSKYNSSSNGTSK